MRDGDIDDVLRQARADGPEVDPALLDRVTAGLGATLKPVRPLPHPSALTAAVAAICLGVGAIAGKLLQLHGIENMSPAQIAVIFPVVVMLAWLAARVCVGEMIPGSRRWFGPAGMLLACCAGLGAAFVAVFSDYQAENFVPQGLTCLKAGVAVAVPAALLVWLALRRGYAVNPTAAAVAMGTVAGLAGIAMLELHCSNFEVPHVLLWHIAVAPVSAVVAFLLARVASSRL
jgi:hypothetical protein